MPRPGVEWKHIIKKYKSSIKPDSSPSVRNYISNSVYIPLTLWRSQWTYYEGNVLPAGASTYPYIQHEKWCLGVLTHSTNMEPPATILLLNNSRSIMYYTQHCFKAKRNGGGEVQESTWCTISMAAWAGHWKSSTQEQEGKGGHPTTHMPVIPTNFLLGLLSSPRLLFQNLVAAARLPNDFHRQPKEEGFLHCNTLGIRFSPQKDLLEPPKYLFSDQLLFIS